ncbi:hypothetical protein GCM10027589_06720 [Actinocorallia lasiicapitis]
MDEIQVRGMIGELAREPMPVGRFDLVAARRRGRRRVLVRRAAGVVAGGLVFAGVAGTVVSVRGNEEGRLLFRPGPLAEAVERFDPLVEFARFGWLPERMGNLHVAVEEQIFTVAATRSGTPIDVYAGSPIEVRFLMAGPDRNPDAWKRQPNAAKYVPVKSAAGRKAFWVIPPRASRPSGLVWEYAPAEWAVLQADVAVFGHKAVLRVAESMEIGGGRRFSWPFKVGPLPKGLVPESAAFELGGRHFASELVFRGAPGAKGAVMVRAGNWIRRTGMDGLPEPTFKLDGHPAATVKNNGGRAELWVFGVQGLTVGITATRGRYPDGLRHSLWKTFVAVPGGTDEPVRSGGG